MYTCRIREAPLFPFRGSAMTTPAGRGSPRAYVRQIHCHAYRAQQTGCGRRAQAACRSLRALKWGRLSEGLRTDHNRTASIFPEAVYNSLSCQTIPYSTYSRVLLPAFWPLMYILPSSLPMRLTLSRKAPGLRSRPCRGPCPVIPAQDQIPLTVQAVHGCRTVWRARRHCSCTAYVRTSSCTSSGVYGGSCPSYGSSGSQLLSSHP